MFHQPCDEPIGHSYRDGDFCSSHYSDVNETAQGFLERVDVGRADVLGRAHNRSTALDEKDFARESRDYRIQEGDVVRFVVGSERTEGAFYVEGTVPTTRKVEDALPYYRTGMGRSLVLGPGF